MGDLVNKINYKKRYRVRQKAISFAIQNLSVKGIKTCVFHGLKHACFDMQNTHVLGQYTS